MAAKTAPSTLSSPFLSPPLSFHSRAMHHSSYCVFNLPPCECRGEQYGKLGTFSFLLMVIRNTTYLYSCTEYLQFEQHRFMRWGLDDNVLSNTVRGWTRTRFVQCLKCLFSRRAALCLSIAFCCRRHCRAATRARPGGRVNQQGAGASPRNNGGLASKLKKGRDDKTAEKEEESKCKMVKIAGEE